MELWAYSIISENTWDDRDPDSILPDKVFPTRELAAIALEQIRANELDLDQALDPDDMKDLDWQGSTNSVLEAEDGVFQYRLYRVQVQDAEFVTIGDMIAARNFQHI